MKNILKVLIGTAPVLALIFYYVMVQQHTADLQMKKQNYEFSQKWHELNSESVFTSDKQSERANAAEDKLKAEQVEKEARGETNKTNGLENNLEKQLNATKEAK
jgi:hypothetical protein